MTTTAPSFGDEFRLGLRENVPVGLAVAAYGAVLGILCATKGMGVATMALMSSLVFAGASQFVAADLWGVPIPILELALATVAINLRYLLIGASCDPLFRERPLWLKALGIHPVADENWALSMRRLRQRGPTGPGHLIGGGVCLYLFWQVGSVTGYILGGGLPEPEVLGLDFAFTAAFIALVVGLWHGKQDLIPWTVAAGAALVADRLIDGTWYVMIGASAGFVTALLLWRPTDAAATAGEIGDNA